MKRHLALRQPMWHKQFLPISKGAATVLSFQKAASKKISSLCWFKIPRFISFPQRKLLIFVCARASQQLLIYFTQGAIFLWEMAKRSVRARCGWPRPSNKWRLLSAPSRENWYHYASEMIETAVEGKRRAPAVEGNYFSQRRRHALFSLI